MGIQINGQTDTITAVDGSLTVSGADLPTVTNLNATGIVTATSFSGPLTGNVTGNATGLSGNPNISVSTIGVNGASPQTPIDAISNSSGNGITVRGRSADGLGNIRFTSNNYATLYGGFKHDASTLTIFNELSGSLKLGTNGIDRVTIDSSGRLTNSYQPCFLAFRGGTQTYSSYDTIIFNDEVFDQGSNYNSSTGIFTAPVTGRYLFLATVLVQSSSTGNDYDIELNTSNRGYFGAPGRTETASGTSWGDGYIAHAVQQIADMDANDTAGIRYITFGGGAIYGGGGWTRFSGYLIC